MSTSDTTSYNLDKITTSVFSHGSAFDFTLIALIIVIGGVMMVQRENDMIFTIGVYAIMYLLINLILKYYNQSIYIPNYKASSSSINTGQFVMTLFGLILLGIVAFLYHDNLSKCRPILFGYVVMTCLYYLSLYHTPIVYKSLDNASYAFKNADIKTSVAKTTVSCNSADCYPSYQQAFRAIYNYVNSKESKLNTYIEDFNDIQQLNIRNRLVELAYLLVRPVEDGINQQFLFSYESFLSNFGSMQKRIYYGVALVVIIVSILYQFINSSLSTDTNNTGVNLDLNPLSILVGGGLLVAFYLIIIFLSFAYKDDPSIKSFDELLFGVGTGTYKLAGAIIGIGIGMAIAFALGMMIVYYGLSFIGGQLAGLVGVGVVQCVILGMLFIQKQTISTIFRDYFKSMTSDETIRQTVNYDEYAASGKMVMYYILMTVLFTCILSLFKDMTVSGIDILKDHGYMTFKGILCGCIFFMIVVFPSITILMNLFVGLIDAMTSSNKSLLSVHPFAILSGKILLEWIGMDTYIDPGSN